MEIKKIRVKNINRDITTPFKKEIQSFKQFTNIAQDSRLEKTRIELLKDVENLRRGVINNKTDIFDRINKLDSDIFKFKELMAVKVGTNDNGTLWHFVDTQKTFEAQVGSESITISKPFNFNDFIISSNRDRKLTIETIIQNNIDLIIERMNQSQMLESDVDILEDYMRDNQTEFLRLYNNIKRQWLENVINSPQWEDTYIKREKYPTWYNIPYQVRFNFYHFWIDDTEF